MMRPPGLLYLRVQRIGVWLPLFLLWPLIPVVLIVAVVVWPIVWLVFRLKLKTDFTGPWGIVALIWSWLCAFQGFRLVVKDDHGDIGLKLI